MRHIILILIICAACIAAAWWVGHLVGALTLQMGAYTIQAPLSVAFVALLLLAILLYILGRLIATLFHLPGAFRRGGERSRRRRGEAAVTGTLIALAAREPADARQLAARAERLLGETPQTLLLKAYAGTIAGDEREAEAAFTKLAARKDAAFLGLRGLLRLAITHGDYARATILARQAEAAHPGAAWLRTERTQLAMRSGNWHEALQLTQDEAPKAGFAAAAAAKAETPRQAHALAKQAYKRDPALTSAALAYARVLRDSGKEKAAQSVLRKSWGLAPHPELADFALANAPDKFAQLKIGQDLVRDAEAHPESHLLIARLKLEAGLPGEANRHIDLAQSGGLVQRRLHLLRADIAEAQGNDTAQKEALRNAAMAHPDNVWRCESCGTQLAAWAPTCPHCHTPARITWSSP